jgi:hypothetical protein
MTLEGRQIILPVLILLTMLPIAAVAGKNINISVDPRIELLGVVQYLSGYEERTGLITDYDFEYKSELDSFFSDFRDHPAVRKFDSISSKGFSFDAPAAAMLYLSNPPELKVVRPFSAYLTGRARGEKNLMDFVEKLRDFAVESKFMDFYNNHSGLYEAIRNNALEKIEGRNYIDIIEEYYGMQNHSYNIILALLFHPGGFGPRIEREDGSFDIYNICGPKGVEENIPHFGTEKDFKYLAWHEFSHSFVNPLTSKHYEQVEKYKDLIGPVEEQMTSQAYPSWPIIVNEHVVRAVTARLAYIHDGNLEGKRALNRETGNGFLYIHGLVKKLKHYEKNRDVYPSFNDFYPELLQAFEEYMPEYAGEKSRRPVFAGNINNAMLNKENIILIIPTHEIDQAIQKDLHEYVGAVKMRIFPNAKILTDEEALAENLSAFKIIAYGTLDGNSYLKAIKDDLPFKIESDSIIADTVYHGTHLRYISSWQNPENPQNGMVIYTAQRAEDIIEINSVFHGPTDYLIARSKETLVDEYYDKTKFPWRF